MSKIKLEVRIDPADAKRARAKSALMEVDDGITFAQRVRTLLKKFISGDFDNLFKK